MISLKRYRKWDYQQIWVLKKSVWLNKNLVKNGQHYKNIIWRRKRRANNTYIPVHAPRSSAWQVCEPLLAMTHWLNQHQGLVSKHFRLRGCLWAIGFITIFKMVRLGLHLGIIDRCKYSILCYISLGLVFHYLFQHFWLTKNRSQELIFCWWFGWWLWQYICLSITLILVVLLTRFHICWVWKYPIH